jgi:hypothetical protein
MLREASAYFAGEGRLHSALRRLTQRLNAEGISYALLGGLALAEHGYPRLTELNVAVRSVYARAGYDWRINYQRPVPPPELRPDMAAWLKQHLSLA